MSDLLVKIEVPHNDTCKADRWDPRYVWFIPYDIRRVHRAKDGSRRGETYKFIQVECSDWGCQAMALVKESDITLAIQQSLNRRR